MIDMASGPRQSASWTRFACDGRVFEYTVEESGESQPWVRVRKLGDDVGPGMGFPVGTAVTSEHAVETARFYWAELTEFDSPEPTPLERAVMAATLTGEHPVLKVLSAQWATATVRKREFSGAGFYATIEVSPHAETLAVKGLAFGDVLVKLPGRADPLGSVIFVRDRRLAMLEMYTFDLPWPKDTSDFVVTYMAEPRSFEQLDEALRSHSTAEHKAMKGDSEP